MKSFLHQMNLSLETKAYSSGYSGIWEFSFWLGLRVFMKETVVGSLGQWWVSTVLRASESTAAAGLILGFTPRACCPQSIKHLAPAGLL